MNAYSSFEPELPANLPSFARHSLPSALRYAGLDDTEKGVELDLRAVWATLYRSRFVIAGALLCAVLLAAASVLLIPPKYRAQASVQIDAQSAKVLNSDDLEPQVVGTETERFIRTQMDILRSRALAGTVAETLGLYKNHDFLPEIDSGNDRHQAVIDKLQKRLTVEMLPNSRIVQIAYDDTDPQLAARIANSFADRLIRSNMDRRYNMSAYSRQFLGGQLAEAKRRLEDSERAALAYARGANLLDASAGATHTSGDGGPKSLATANLVELNDSYSAARAARIQAEERWRQAQATPVMNLAEVLANPTIQTMTERRAELQTQFEEERQRHKAEYPLVQQLAAKIAEIDRQIAATSTAIRSSIHDQFSTAQRQESALASDVSGLKGVTLAEQDRSVQYNILKREVDTSREMYDGLLQRFKEVSAAAGISDNNIAVIDRADPPEKPISPSLIINLAIAVLSALSLSMLYILGRERFMDRFRDPEEIQRKLDLPVLGVVPVLTKQMEPHVALADTRSGFSEAYNSICAALEFTSATGLPRSIMMTSSHPGEGKSTTAVALAVSLVRQGKRVVLIDADLRRPSLHALLNLPDHPGLVHLLNGSKSIAEVAQETGLEGLSFISSGPQPPSPSSLLSAGVLTGLLAKLSHAYDVAIFDAPPVLGLADAPLLSSGVEATLFVIENGTASVRVVRRAIQRLADSRARLVGTVMTKYRSSSPYGIDYGYTYEYGARDASKRPPRRTPLFLSADDFPQRVPESVD